MAGLRSLASAQKGNVKDAIDSAKLRLLCGDFQRLSAGLTVADCFPVR